MSQVFSTLFTFTVLTLFVSSCSVDSVAPPPPNAVAIFAELETEPVLTSDDAADDPVIWINEARIEESRVLGTDKGFGLEVYDLAGNRLQRIPAGRTNNVDLRPLSGKEGWSAIAAASNRSFNTISLFAIDRTGTVSWLQSSEISTGLTEPYGLCMYQSDVGTQVFVNDKDGRYQQWLLVEAPDEDGLPRFTANLLREFRVQSQPEGCTVDDEYDRLFLGVEEEGVFTLPAEHTAAAELSTVALIDSEILAADVEGMDLYLQPEGAGYLLVSSQGNYSYAVYERLPPHAYHGSFLVSDSVEHSVDGSQETDGLAVSSLLNTARFPQGLVVVQDGFNSNPVTSQNFKYVSWQEISKALNL